MIKPWTPRRTRAAARCGAVLQALIAAGGCCALAQPVQSNPPARADALPDLLPEIAPAAAASGAKEKRIVARPLGDRLPEKPSLNPSFSIPVAALGFAAPGSVRLGERIRLASLDFLNEDRILFTFRVPGLIHRDNGRPAGDEERRIRALVMDARTGRIEAEALWTLHDLKRYLWTLKDGRFLLRDRDGLQEGDSSLELKPFLQFPGPVDWIEMDPQQQYMVTNSREPAAAQASQPGGSPGSAAQVAPAGKSLSSPDDTVVRILERSSGRVMLVSRVRAAIDLPINADGYLERLRGSGQNWLLNLNYFNGGNRIVGRVESSCSPVFDFISSSEFLVTACNAAGGNRLTAFATDGRRLWDDDTTSLTVWPIAVMSQDGSRLAHETLRVSRPVNAYSPLDFADVKGQLVRVINTADGTVALEAAASPPLDSGGNVAISASGRRVAVLNDGAIEIFELPPAPPLAAPDAKVAAR